MPRPSRLAATTLLGAVAVVEVMASTQGFASATVHAPHIALAKVKCVVTSYENIPGQNHVPLYSPRVSWKVTHASGMALSVDDPNLVGSYGTYGKSGSITLGGGCYTDDGTTTITFNTVGGHGKRAHKTIVLTGTKNHVVPPPESKD